MPSSSRNWRSRSVAAARHEIADGRAGEEAELGQIGDVIGQAEGPSEIGDDRHARRSRESAAAARPRSVRDNRRKYRPARRPRERSASSRIGVLVAEPAPNSTTAALVGTQRGDFRHDRSEQGGLDPSRIISRQPGDVVEQLGPAEVVEPARGNRRDRAPTGRRGRRRGTARFVRQASRASRSPVNCQRASGGKKLR